MFPAAERWGKTQIRSSVDNRKDLRQCHLTTYQWIETGATERLFNEDDHSTNIFALSQVTLVVGCIIAE
jgi:hypothetical protein